MLLFVVFVVLSVQLEDKVVHYNLNDARALFHKFITEYNRTYKGKQDRHIHFGYFKKNLETINELNERYYPDTTFVINKFADFSMEEMDKWLGDRH